MHVHVRRERERESEREREGGGRRKRGCETGQKRGRVGEREEGTHFICLTKVLLPDSPAPKE